MISLHFIVEGRTEELFIQHCIAPYLKSINANVIITKHNLAGGIVLDKLTILIENNLKKYDLVTTMIDLVGLNSAKIKNYSSIMEESINSAAKATQVEAALMECISFDLKDKFIPHVQPYEFEALCFADIEALCNSDPEIAKYKHNINKELLEYPTPECINNNNFPSKRLKKYMYSKSSTLFAKNCSIDKIREKCPHFDSWIIKLVQLVKEDNTCQKN